MRYCYFYCAHTPGDYCREYVTGFYESSDQIDSAEALEQATKLITQSLPGSVLVTLSLLATKEG